MLYARFGNCTLGPGDPDTSCNNDTTGAPCPLTPPGSASSSLSFGSSGQGLYFLWIDGYVGGAMGLPSEGSYGVLVGGL